MISRISRWGSMPLRARAVRTSSARWGEISWRLREIDRQGEVLRLRGVPGRQLLARLDQHPPSERDDEPGLLGDGDEPERGHLAEARMAPPHQRLEPLQPVVGEGDDGLVLQEELRPAERPAEAVGQIEPLEHAGPHGRPEHLDPVLPLLLGLVHGRVRLAQELLGGLARPAKATPTLIDKPDLVALEVGGVAEHGDDAVGEVHGGLGVLHVDHQHRELVAARGGPRCRRDARSTTAAGWPATGRCRRRCDRGCR